MEMNEAIDRVQVLIAGYTKLGITEAEARKLIEIGQQVLSDREKRAAVCLKQAHKFISYENAFRGRATSRVEMEAVFQRWQEHRPSSVGIGIGATYLNDAEFNFEKTEAALKEVEDLNGSPLKLPDIWA